jgi:uncharacterized membrane protein
MEGEMVDLPSNVRVGRRQIHRWLAAFMASCFVGTLATDVAYWGTANMQWADFSAWLLSVGVVVGWVAVVVALIEMLVVRSPLRSGVTWPYAIGSLIALILATVNTFMHTRDAWTSVVPWGLVLSAATVLVLILTGWMMWEPYVATDKEVIA